MASRVAEECGCRECRKLRGEWSDRRRIKNVLAEYCSDTCRWREKDLRMQDAYRIVKEMARPLLREMRQNPKMFSAVEALVEADEPVHFAVEVVL